MKRMSFFQLLTGVALSICVTAMAVTDEEVQKITEAMPDKPVVRPAAERTVLVFSLCNGFKHSCIPYWQKALDVMSEKTGAFRVVHSTDMAIFTEESLKPFDAICLNNTTKLTPNAAQQKAIMDFITSGKGIIGIHAATDNFDDWPQGAMMMGGIFKGHPWTAGGTWAIKIDEPQHPLMQPFEGKSFKVNDEIYRTLGPQYSRSNQRVLMSLDMSDPATKNAKGVTPEDADTGISWIKPVGKGRLFYCSLGHNHNLTWTAPVLAHYLAGIQYALGDLKADDSPISRASASDQSDKIDALIGQIKRTDWNHSTEPMFAFEQLLRDQSSNVEVWAAAESRLLEALKTESTGAAKDFFCRMLLMVGTEKSVPMLAKMLNDPSTFNPARLALEKIPGQKAEAALLTAVDAVKETTHKAALLISLGNRKSLSAINAIAKALADKDPVIAFAAADALACIGTEQAAKALKETAVTDPGLKNRRDEALLRCADVLIKEGKTQAARTIYHDLYSDQAAGVIKAGALAGLAQSQDPQAGRCILDALKSDDPFVCKAAAKVIASSQDKKLLEESAGTAGGLKPQSQIQLITALSQNPLHVGRIAAENLIASSEKEVRAAAYHALTSLATAESVLVLGRAAVAETDRNEQQAAQQALYAISDAKADQIILAAIADNKMDEPVRIEMIQAAVQRQSPDSVEVILATAGSTNQKLASQSVRALQLLAGPADVDTLTEMLVQKPGTGMESALTAAAMKIPDADYRADGILKRYTATDSAQAKASLLRVMGKLGDADCIAVLNQEFRSADPVLSEAAFRGMSDWPGSDFKSVMKDIAAGSGDLKRKVLAFRGYVRMLGTDSVALIESYSMANRPEEKKIVIGALAETSSVESIAFLRKLFQDPQLATEAEMSVIGVCEKLAEANPKEVKSALNQLVQHGSTETVKKRAQEIIWNMK